jgi:hypothetical protein
MHHSIQDREARCQDTSMWRSDTMFQMLHLRCSALVESCSARDLLIRIGNRSEPFGRHSFPRPKYTTPKYTISLRRTRDTLNRYDGRKCSRQGEGIEDAKVGADAPDRRWFERGRRRKVYDAATTPATNQPPKDPLIPKISPMPMPEIEEPLSDSGSAEGKKPLILGIPLNSTDDARATSPSAPSPLFDMRSLSTSPLSAVSSLHDAGAMSS